MSNWERNLDFVKAQGVPHRTPQRDDLYDEDWIELDELGIEPEPDDDEVYREQCRIRRGIREGEE